MRDDADIRHIETPRLLHLTRARIAELERLGFTIAAAAFARALDR